MPWKGLASVENTFDGETVEESVAQMPEGIYSHCLVDLEGGDLFKAGGLYRAPGSFIVRPSDKTHVYRVVQKKCPHVLKFPPQCCQAS